MICYNIAVLEGDGIGKEVMKQAIDVIDKLSKKYNFEVNYTKASIGGEAIDKFGTPLPENTVEICKNSDSVLLGAVGGKKWENCPGNIRPEDGLLGIRKSLGLFANLRRCSSISSLSDFSPIKKDILGSNLDILIVRELTGGMYFGEKGRKVGENDVEFAYDVEKYSTYEIKRIAKVAFDLATKRSNKLCSVDKANVLESSRLWRKCVEEIAKEYPKVELSHMYVDNCAMQLIKNPSQFDVIVTSNIFGDILSDEASVLCGSLGLLPSASLGDTSLGLYEPVHGSAPDIQGQNKANPIAMILSVAMMFEYSLGRKDISEDIQNAVMEATKEHVTADLSSDKFQVVSCSDMGELICSYL